MIKRSVAIIGGGVSGIMLAAHLDQSKFEINIYEKGKAAGRKFLVAGDGGLNLTHSENSVEFINKYTAPEFIKKAFQKFDNEALVKWFSSIGIETFVGSSKRVFPLKGIKPVTVLNAMMRKLEEKNVKINYGFSWKGWKDDSLLFLSKENEVEIKSDIVVFAMGGGSWKVTGSDGLWTEYFKAKNIKIKPLKASNCEYCTAWPEKFIEAAEGHVLKNISVSCNGENKKGELVITRNGIEGGPVYALSPQIRAQLKKISQAIINIDLKPSLSKEEIISRLNKVSGSVASRLKSELNLGNVAVLLLKNLLSKDDFIDTGLLAAHIKSLEIIISGTGPIDEAISTVGGISSDEFDEHFALKKIKNHYAIGEMLDWDAPTGGYLLQACFSMGVALARHLNTKD